MKCVACADNIGFVKAIDHGLRAKGKNDLRLFVLELNNDLKGTHESRRLSSAYENIVFCWVMHEQSIIDAISAELDTDGCRVINVSLTVDEGDLRNRLSYDVKKGIRSEDVIERSIARISMYQVLDTVKVDTNDKTVLEIANEIMAL